MAFQSGSDEVTEADAAPAAWGTFAVYTVDMKSQFVIVMLIALCGCANNVPPWSKANAEARSSGMFIPDDAYYASQQFTNDVHESVATVERLRQQLGHDEATVARRKLNASMHSLQMATETNAAQQQAVWEAQVYAASPNVTAKVTTMVNPANAHGQIIEIQVLTYYDKGRMRYATNFFDPAK